MRVDPTTGRSLPQVRPGTSTPARAADTPGEAPATEAAAGGFTPTDELTRLLSGVRETPEVRADVVNSVAARLAAGEFNTPEAAADAARNLLGSGNLGAQ